jgi:hypothetical protein
MSGMFANKEVATRHLPIAHGPDPRDARGEGVRARDRQPESRRPSETRLQATVVVERKRDDVDPYADVPCTD